VPKGKGGGEKRGKARSSDAVNLESFKSLVKGESRQRASAKGACAKRANARNHNRGKKKILIGPKRRKKADLKLNWTTILRTDYGEKRGELKSIVRERARRARRYKKKKNVSAHTHVQRLGKEREKEDSKAGARKVLDYLRGKTSSEKWQPAEVRQGERGNPQARGGKVRVRRLGGAMKEKPLTRFL